MNRLNPVNGTMRRGGSRQRGFLSSRQAFVLLGLLFLAPTFVAWVMHHSGGPEGTTNRGMLVHPARPLTLPAGLLAGEQPINRYLQGLWTIVYIGDGDCDAVCKENLYKMRQIRTAQNENMKRVQTLYLLQGDAVPSALAELVADEYHDLTVALMSEGQAQAVLPFFSIDDSAVLAAERVYFIDPLGNLMMYYAPDAAAGGMLKDLQKLLKYSKIG